MGFREMAGPRAGSCQRLIVFGYGIPGIVGIRRRGDRDVDEVGGRAACLPRSSIKPRLRPPCASPSFFPSPFLSSSFLPFASRRRARPQLTFASYVHSHAHLRHLRLKCPPFAGTGNREIRMERRKVSFYSFSTPHAVLAGAFSTEK